MARLCERPGCSETGAVAYGMMPEHLLFWISPLADAPTDDPGVLCGRHADAMVVPRGWTLDDRRERALRLFTFRTEPAAAPPVRSPRRRALDEPRHEQLVIDGTGELPRPVIDDSDIDVETPESPESPDVADAADGADDAQSASRSQPAGDSATPWLPAFDHDDDLDGLLEVRSPLLARAFRGTGRPRR